MSEPHWTEVVRLGELSRGAVHRSLSAGAPARRRIADLLDLPALESLDAEVEAAPWLDGARVSGRWSARVVQTCGLSLEDFASDLAGAFEVRCVPTGSPLAPAADAEIVLDPDAPDPPDVLDGDVIDLGAYVVEHLALELDPFPRRPGAAFEPPVSEPEPSPFGVLAQLKPRPPKEAQ